MFFCMNGPAQVAGSSSIGRYASAASTISSTDGSWSSQVEDLARRLTEALVGADDCSDHARIHHHAFVGRRG